MSCGTGRHEKVFTVKFCKKGCIVRSFHKVLTFFTFCFTMYEYVNVCMMGSFW